MAALCYRLMKLEMLNSILCLLTCCKTQGFLLTFPSAGKVKIPYSGCQDIRRHCCLTRLRLSWTFIFGKSNTGHDTVSNQGGLPTLMCLWFTYHFEDCACLKWVFGMVQSVGYFLLGKLPCFIAGCCPCAIIPPQELKNRCSCIDKWLRIRSIRMTTLGLADSHVSFLGSTNVVSNEKKKQFLFGCKWLQGLNAVQLV